MQLLFSNNVTKNKKYFDHKKILNIKKKLFISFKIKKFVFIKIFLIFFKNNEKFIYIFEFIIFENISYLIYEIYIKLKS
jgi:hypothetical protein